MGESGGERWLPLFFGIDGNGSVFIPDFGNDQVASFDSRGRFLGSDPGIGSVTPRMQYFDRAPDGSYVALSDGTLARSKRDGEILWTVPFPLGIFPEDVVCTDAGVFIVVAKGIDRIEAFKIPHTPPYAALKSLKDGALSPIPMIEAGGRAYTWRLADMARTRIEPGWKRLDASYGAIFVNAGPLGTSVWRSDSARAGMVSVRAANGAAIQTISLSESGIDTSEWYAVRAVFDSTGAIIYVMQASDSALAIRSFRVVDR